VLIKIVACFAFCAHCGKANANEFEFVLRETIVVPTGFPLRAVTDMDGDGELDVVLGGFGTDGFKILERNGLIFTERFAFSQSGQRAVAVGDVDSDGLPEVLTGTSSAITIHESFGDDAYQIVHQAGGLGSYIERNVQVADSSGNGKLEFLIPRESFPSRISILEGSTNNTYTNLGTVEGTGGNNFFAGVCDLDNDGLVEIVFGDDNYSSTRRTYVYENGVLVYQNNTLNPEFLGDTDRNGLQEFIGRDNLGNLIIWESNGNNSFAEVYNEPGPPGLGTLGQHSDRTFVEDVNGDGWDELVLVGGATNVVTAMRRSGATLVNVWDSGDLFESFPGGIGSVLTIGDSNGDGNPELAVLQQDLLHILELAVPEPSSLTLGTLGLVGLIAYRWRRRRNGLRKPSKSLDRSSVSQFSFSGGSCYAKGITCTLCVFCLSCLVAQSSADDVLPPSWRGEDQTLFAEWASWANPPHQS
jgi:hypothetical protein